MPIPFGGGERTVPLFCCSGASAFSGFAHVASTELGLSKGALRVNDAAIAEVARKVRVVLSVEGRTE